MGEGRTLTFAVSAHGAVSERVLGDGVLGDGVIVRAVVDRERFLGRR